jgi:poly(3-hydroxybutyrate) depolymerase
VVAYGCLQQEIDQWTNVHGLPDTPTATDTPQSGWTRRRYADSTGTTRVEAISVAGAGHALPMSGMAAYAIAFFGLNTTSRRPAPVLPRREPDGLPLPAHRARRP